MLKLTSSHKLKYDEFQDIKDARNKIRRHLLEIYNKIKVLHKKNCIIVTRNYYNLADECINLHIDIFENYAQAYDQIHTGVYKDGYCMITIYQFITPIGSIIKIMSDTRKSTKFEVPSYVNNTFIFGAEINKIEELMFKVEYTQINFYEEVK